MPSRLTCVPHSRHAEEPCWCRWMAAVHTTACCRRPSSTNSVKWRRNGSRSCACFTGALPRTAGGTAQAAAGTFPRAKAVSEGTPSPLYFSPSDNTMVPSQRPPRRFPGRPLCGHDGVHVAIAPAGPARCGVHPRSSARHLRPQSQRVAELHVARREPRQARMAGNASPTSLQVPWSQRTATRGRPALQAGQLAVHGRRLRRPFFRTFFI